MYRFAILLMFGLAGCTSSGAGQTAGSRGGDVRDWRFVSGKQPTRADYAAIVAACQAGAVTGATGQPLDSCLADLGLRRGE